MRARIFSSDAVTCRGLRAGALALPYSLADQNQELQGCEKMTKHPVELFIFDAMTNNTSQCVDVDGAPAHQLRPTVSQGVLGTRRDVPA